MEDPLPHLLHLAAGAGHAQEVERILASEASGTSQSDSPVIISNDINSLPKIESNIDENTQTEDNASTKQKNSCFENIEKGIKNITIDYGNEREEEKDVYDSINVLDSILENAIENYGDYTPRESMTRTSATSKRSMTSLVHDRDAGGQTALHAAAEKAGEGATASVGLLLDAGADTETRDASGATPLHLTAYWGHAGSTRHLLHAGADPTTEWIADLSVMLRDSRVGGAAGEKLTWIDKKSSGDGQVPLAALHIAAGAGHVAVMKELLEAGVEVNAATTLGSTPLHLAIAGGHEGAIEVLLAAGATTDIADTDGRTPLHAAAFVGRPTSLRILLQHSGNKVAEAVNARDAAGTTPLHLAAGGGIAELLRRMIRASERENAEAMWKRQQLKELFMQVGVGMTETVALLLAAGAAVNARDAGGAQPLLHAALGGRVDAMRVLLHAGADLQTRGLLSPCPPMHDAATRQALMMLHPGEEKAAETSQGVTALHAAVAAPENEVEAVRLLLEAGVDKEAEIKDAGDAKWRALHVAARLGRLEVLKTLLAAKVDVEPKDVYGRSPLHVAAAFGQVKIIQELLAAGVNPDARDSTSASPLLLAVGTNNLSAVETLLAGGASPALADAHGRTPLLYAARLNCIATCQILLAEGASPSAADVRGRTPLHVVGDAVVARALLEAGADVTARDKQGATPLHRAVAAGRVEVVRVLLDSGANPEATWTLQQSVGNSLGAKAGRTEALLSAIQKSTEEQKAIDNNDDQDYLISGKIIKKYKTLPGIYENEITSPNSTESAEKYMILLTHNAAAHGHVNILRMLLQRGLSPSGKMTRSSSTKEQTRGNNTNPESVITSQPESVITNTEAVRNHRGESNLTLPANEKARQEENTLTATKIEEESSTTSLTSATAEMDVTPLHLAVAGGHMATVQTLLHAGAASEAVTNDGRTALNYAMLQGDEAMAQALLATVASTAATGIHDNRPGALADPALRDASGLPNSSANLPTEHSENHRKSGCCCFI